MKRVVLLGGGYVTLHAYGALARRLRGELRRGEVEIVVISADTVHNFHGFTGEVVAGLLPIGLTQTPLTEAMPRARVLHARVTRVDLGGPAGALRRRRRGASPATTRSSSAPGPGAARRGRRGPGR